ncbi:MAG TPA: DUF1513 domain-containing protein [Noviherbaspirillum sp.]|uniref:DUF1513 domain-containing protein n=1 Tax=Noviherbaspirillum sp. TaxID=1926288 RepID=UPI002F936890
MIEKKRLASPGRRRLLIASVLASVTPARGAAARSDRLRLAAAWNDESGHRVGVLERREEAMLPHASIEVPTRAHGLLAEADGSLLVVSRRPGDWMLRWHPARRTLRWVWAEPGRAFNGHVTLSKDATRLFTTETDLDSGQGLLGVWDARTLEKQEEWPTGGIDPHMMLVDGAGVFVANGGVPTQPETGRAKRNLHGMDSSLVRLDTADGSLQGQWRVPDRRLSLRHMARNGSRIGIAMQAEHDTQAERDQAPVLVIFDGRALVIPDAGIPTGLAGYGGDIATWQDGFAVGAPRAQGVACWSAGSGWHPLLPLADACAVTFAHGGLWAGGSGEALGVGPSGKNSLALPTGLRMDNHWVPL